MLRFALVVLAGLAIDWGLYSRLAGILGQHYSSNDGYLTFLYPRIIVTALSLVFVAYSIGEGDPKLAVFFIGLALFVGSNLYAVYRFYRGDEIGR